MTVAARPTQGQVGESWHQRPVDQHTIAGDTWRPPTEGQQQPTDSVELYRRGERALQEQDTAVDATQREWAWMQVRQRADTATQTPAPVQPDEPNEQPGWLVVTLGVLAAVLAFMAGLAVLAARREPQGRSGDLTTVTPLDGAAAPTGSPIA